MNIGVPKGTDPHKIPAYGVDNISHHGVTTCPAWQGAASYSGDVSAIQLCVFRLAKWEIDELDPHRHSIPQCLKYASRQTYQ